MPDAQQAADGPEEVRLALVLNGGVSLAVWIGGVTHEIDRLRRAGYEAGEGVGDWKALVDALQLRVNVDVIAGASAGGLNGAVLAAAVARGHALPSLRQTWLDVADLGDRSTRRPRDEPPDRRQLLTRDHHWSTPSVLDGDFFLDEIGKVFADTDPAACCAPTDVTVYLTGTSLTGMVGTYDDETGRPFSHREYRVRFRFQRATEKVGTAGDSEEGPNDFPAAAEERADADARLARAARATASFPGAFVPVYCRGEEDGVGPRMSQVSNLTSGRWVMDGGVLDNEPFRPVFDEIRRRPVDGPVDRVLAYVVPYGGAETPGQADPAQPAPGPISVLPKVFNLPREVGIVDDLTTLRELLASVAVDQTARRELLRSAVSQPAALKALTTAMLPAYRRRRVFGAIWQARELLAETPGEHIVSLKPIPPWSDSQADPPDAPWVPRAIAVDDPGSWSWGVSVADAFVRTWLAVIREVLQRSTTPALTDAAHVVSRQLLRLDSIAAAYAKELRATLGTTPGQPDDLILAAARDAFAKATGPPGASGAPWLRAIVDATAQQVLAIADDLRSPYRELLPKTPKADAVLRQHLQAEVAFAAYQAPSLEPPVPRFRFRRMSPDPVSPLDTDRQARQGTIMGLGLNHFGGFLKREWRANDWMWGRLHGVHHLVRTLLTRDRLGVLQDTDRLGAAVTALTGLLQPSDPAVAGALERLATLTGDTDADVDADIDVVCTALVKQLQTAILLEELPTLALAAVEPNTPWPAWVRTLYPDGTELGSPVTDASRAIEAFRGCRIADTESVQTFAATAEGQADELAAFLAVLRALGADSRFPARLQRPLRVVEADFDHSWSRHMTERAVHAVEHLLRHVPRL